LIVRWQKKSKKGARSKDETSEKKKSNNKNK